MVTRDKRVDAYIENAAEFAQPILTELRARVHKSCPDVVETLKWRMPSFEHKGILCGMAAFKKHAVFGFWKHNLVVADDSKESAGQLGPVPVHCSATSQTSATGRQVVVEAS